MIVETFLSESSGEPELSTTPEQALGFKRNSGLDDYFLVDSFFQVGYVYKREQARRSLIDKATKILVQAESYPGFISRRGPYVLSIARSHKRKAGNMAKVIRRLRKFP